MKRKGGEAIKVIDLFAGPGGLGEGFSGYTTPSGRKPFKILLSAEMETHAYRTLTVRSWYRQFERSEDVPDCYFAYLNNPALGLESLRQTPETEKAWKQAKREARNLELGKVKDDKILYEELKVCGPGSGPRIVIGGPPCQAYSIVGRVRNQGIKNYSIEDDHRHGLYREYLKVLSVVRPHAFVMENVKGIISSKVDGGLIFEKILNDLMDPVGAVRQTQEGKKIGYRLFSISTGKGFSRNKKDESFDPRAFVVRAEDFGIPQRRHRVFVVGIREDIAPEAISPLSPVSKEETPGVRDAIGDLPLLRSHLSKEEDSSARWTEIFFNNAATIREIINRNRGNDLFQVQENSKLIALLEKAEKDVTRVVESNDKVFRKTNNIYKKQFEQSLPDGLKDFIRNDRLLSFSNHETRGHIKKDLLRYLFCSLLAGVSGVSPKAFNFPESLAPAHNNWGTGKFSDRFRVQIAEQPATTITSHISKDGHYFIHYDPAQCRSLTVREAARLQTFPDDYFFEGPRTHQFIQVGNAVPPFLARKIAGVILSRIEGTS